MKALEAFLQETESMHRHRCPRQVLGVRMGLLAGKVLRMNLPQEGKRLLAIVETDGCAVDGISVVTNCTIGHRTLRVEDYGKIAATFVDTETNDALRIVPRSTIRGRAPAYAPTGVSTWQAHLLGYERMPDEELLLCQPVELALSLEKIISRAGRKAICQRCGEEIINGRETLVHGNAICLSCLCGGYYRLKGDCVPMLPSEFEAHRD